MAVGFHVSDLMGDAEGEAAQGGVESYGCAALFLAVKQEAFGDGTFGDLENFFQAEGLGAELDFVSAVGLRFTAFVFDGDDASVLMNFDDVADAGEAVCCRSDGQASCDAYAGAGFAFTGVGTLVEDAAFGGGPILRPDPLHMDECTLPRTIQVVLESREGDGVGRLSHGGVGLDCIHLLVKDVCLSQVTIRRVDERCVAKAKAEAKRRGVSMNEVLREGLRRGLGVDAEKPRRNNLDQYAGDSDFGPDWDRYLEKDLKQIDKELWT